MSRCKKSIPRNEINKESWSILAIIIRQTLFKLVAHCTFFCEAPSFDHLLKILCPFDHLLQISFCPFFYLLCCPLLNDFFEFFDVFDEFIPGYPIMFPFLFHPSGLLLL